MAWKSCLTKLTDSVNMQKSKLNQLALRIHSDQESIDQQSPSLHKQTPAKTDIVTLISPMPMNLEGTTWTATLGWYFNKDP